MIHLEQDEHVILVAHRHWFIFAMRALGIALVALVPFFLVGIISQIDVDFSLGALGNITPLVAAALTAWLSIIWMMFFISWTNYYLDSFVLTNKKLIEIEQKGLFSREVSSFQLSRIQDITVDIHGITPTLFNYGVVHVQTAGDQRNFMLKSAAEPYKIKSRILEEYNKIAPTQI